MAKSKGRTRGTRNRGYFYRTGRGWGATIQGKFVPLEYANGDRMCDRATPIADVKAALKRAIAVSESIQSVSATQAELRAPEKESIGGNAQVESATITIWEVCVAYLAQAKATGANTTYRARAGILFDFCFGLPSNQYD